MHDRIRRRFIAVIILIAIVFSILVIRITKLMFFQKEFVSNSPELTGNLERGFITDRNGEKLALSLETYSVYVRPNEIENKKEAAFSLSRLLDMPYRDILRSMNTRKPFVWIKRQLGLAYNVKLEHIDIRGVYTDKEYKRYYPFNSLAAQVIGFAGIDQKGLEGIEYEFDKVLYPKIQPSAGSLSSYKRGYSVVLTIDRYIQEIVEEEIEKAYRQTGSKLINAIVIQPSSGQILAMANRPGYDLNHFKDYTEETIRNKAITDTFEPGSTFKIFIASILMDKGLVHEDDTFTCRGSINVGGVTIHDTSVHGVINFRGVLEQSCNVGMIESAGRIDDIGLFENLRAFGFGTPTGIMLPGEAYGILRNPKDWSKISKSEMAIGQEVSATALQLITAASAIANGGVLMQPRIVRRIERPDGSLVKEFNPLKIRRVIQQKTASEILDILIGVLSDRGTGYKAKMEGYTIAGKTGTAQIADTKKGGYLEDQFYASFVGFVPVPNPKIVILVTLDRPVGEVYGGQTAAPVFKNIVERIAPYLNILPAESEVYVIQ